MSGRRAQAFRITGQPCCRGQGHLYSKSWFFGPLRPNARTVNLTAIGERAVLSVAGLAPKQLYSSAIGWGARRRIPRLLRRPVLRAFSRAVGIDLGEVELPLDHYPSLSSFFARRLRPGSRDISAAEAEVVSPCDGRVGAAGAITEGTLLQAKGRHYHLADLLADAGLAASLGGGRQLTLYLSPADYHRVHSPVAGRLVRYSYIPGTLFPVGPFFSERLDQLFARNERMVLELETAAGPVALVLVGATGVGNLRLAAPALETRRFRRQRVARTVRLEEPIEVARGQELGAFNLGSTVVMVFAEGAWTPDHPEIGQPVRCGQPLGAMTPEHLVQVAR